MVTLQHIPKHISRSFRERKISRKLRTEFLLFYSVSKEMAKWGEGDPRWIVEERPDATNVNNWHWTEKNACAWSQEKIKELFKDVIIERDGFKCKIMEIEKCEGEAVANNRKGKLIFFYEWNICLKWVSLNTETEINGKINIPNLSEENEISEIDVEVILNTNTDEGEKFKHFLYTKGKDIIREKLAKYVSSLKEEFTKGMILPKKDGIENISNKTTRFNRNTPTNIIIESYDSKANNYIVQTTTIKQQLKFMCSGTEFYKVMTIPEFVMAFTKGPAKLFAEKGGQFELLCGVITGEFVDLTPTKIVQKWRCKSWPAGHYSEVTMDIVERHDHTEVNVTQTAVPI
ncbi:PREDICTED: activator of 90 kDa heat shock protein ATPase homolog 2-like, partial [Ceratosolen solmsi marchali]